MPDDMEFSQDQLNALFGDQPIDDSPPPKAGNEPAFGAESRQMAPEPMPQFAGVAAGPAAGPPAQVNAASFVPLTPNGGAGDTSGIDLLLDVMLQVSVELGRTRMTIGDVLALRTGSVIELDKLAGEPADILVNGTLIARGEVVVVDDKFGVRVKEVVPRQQRLESLA